MRDSILDARRRQHERLSSLVRRVVLTCTDDEAAEIERLVALVRAGAMPARDAHALILASLGAQQRAA